MKEFTEAELRAAYEMCILVKSNSDNVLASLEKGEDGSSDKEWSRMATKFIKAYERVNAYKLAKTGKAGYMGDALMKLESISKSLKNIKV
jgi:hypothetical protein